MCLQVNYCKEKFGAVTGVINLITVEIIVAQKNASKRDKINIVKVGRTTVLQERNVMTN